MPTSARVLIAEDEAAVLRSLEKAFAHHGYVVKACADGKEALGAFLSDAWDLVVTDICMPRMDGITLAEEVRRAASHVPVLFVTGSASEKNVAERLRRALESDPLCAMLRKPVKLEALLREAEALLGRKPGRRPD